MGIFPSHKNLDLNKGTDFRLRLSNSHWQTSDNKLKISSPATFTLGEGLKNPAKDEKDVGLFIPHIYFTFTYDFAGQKKWMATGPFSGCMVGVFTQGSNGVGLAHIHKGGRTDATVAWENFKKQDDVSVHYERRIPAPLKGNSCSYLFLDLTDKNSLMLSQIDLQVNGAADWGRVCHVKHVTGFSKV